MRGKTDHKGWRPAGRRRAIVVGIVMIVSVALAGGTVMATHDPGAPDLGAVGPVSADNGYPTWYRDAHGTEVELCLDFADRLCGFVGNEIPEPSSPVSFPFNFPGEAFWWSAESSIDTGNGSALLIMAVEAAFASGEEPQEGDQISFGRVRIRLDGLIPHASYTVTHPYGSTIVTAEPDGSVFVTQDIGSLTTPADFSAALDSPVLDGLLEWDASLPSAPLGYLGDPDLAHAVTGSPTGNNVFRVEGPAGSFTGSPNLCVGVDDCIESDMFFVMGKRAATSGVEAVRAVYVNPSQAGASDYLEVFAKSRPGQTIHVSGAGINTVEMLGDGDLYHAKIFVSGVTPTEITATNHTDGTSWTAPVTDAVTITSAEYDLVSGVLTVQASSSDSSGLATLTADAGGTFIGDTLNTSLLTAPLDVTVTSSGGGSDAEPVRLVGPDFSNVPVVAVASADPATAIPLQTVTLDGSGSTGDIDVYEWTQVGGTAVSIANPNLAITTFEVPDVTADEDLQFTLNVTGLANPDSASVTVHVVAGESPIAEAGDNQDAIVGETVTLDGSGSSFASAYQWTQVGGAPLVVLTDGDTAVAKFDMPTVTDPTTQLVFALTAGTNPPTIESTDTVTITQTLDVITVVRAEFRSRKGQLRVEGLVSVFSVTNEVSIYEGGSFETATPELLGTATVDPVDGTFALKLNDGVDLTSDSVDIVTTRGGFLREWPLLIRN